MASPTTSASSATRTEAPLTDRQRSILREAARCDELISVFEYPHRRREQLGSTSWDQRNVELPSDAEIRELVRGGYLLRGPVSPATTFAITDEGRSAI
ncbi:MAG: hypothetical protein Q7T55_08735 [Solirubrobacteraceae bacterium]|nr:hypothetical protein [Solirubrobacteraceae bacterium]